MARPTGAATAGYLLGAASLALAGLTLPRFPVARTFSYAGGALACVLLGWLAAEAMLRRAGSPPGLAAWSATASLWVTLVVFGLTSVPPPVLAPLGILGLFTAGAAIGGARAYLLGKKPATDRAGWVFAASLVVGPMAMFGMLSPAFGWLIFPAMTGVASLVASFMWAFLGAPLARLIMLGPAARKRGSLEAAAAPAFPLSAHHVVRLSKVPLFFSYAAALWVQALSPTWEEGSDPWADVAKLILVATMVFATLSPFILPGRWILDLFELRWRDAATGYVRHVEGPRPTNEMVGISAVIAFIAVNFSLGGGLTPWGLYDVAGFSAITFAAILPASVLATLLYSRWRLARDASEARAWLGFAPAPELAPPAATPPEAARAPGFRPDL